MLDQVTAPPAGGGFASPEKPAVERLYPQFDGRAGEYFGIWFVNLVLSILTLGIYSAWAKVRTERYFYGNTRIGDSSFDYLADPIAILKGRLVAYAVLIALSVSSHFAPLVYLGLILVVFALLPLVIVLGLRFRARNSAWRGLTFRFDESAAAAYGPFMGWPLLSLVTGTLLYPIAKLRQQAFVANGHWFGRRRFAFLGEPGPYYVPYAIAAGLGVLLFVGVIVISVAIALASAGGEPSGAGASVGVLATVALMYLGIFVIAIFMRVRYANLMWNNVRLGEHRFESSLRVRDMLWLYGSNLVAIICTLGLAVPWAMVRLARYRSEHFVLLAHGGLEGFVAEAERDHDATGAELVDALDVGMDFGL